MVFIFLAWKPDLWGKQVHSSKRDESGWKGKSGWCYRMQKCECWKQAGLDLRGEGKGAGEPRGAVLVGRPRSLRQVMGWGEHEQEGSLAFLVSEGCMCSCCIQQGRDTECYLGCCLHTSPECDGSPKKKKSTPAVIEGYACPQDMWQETCHSPCRLCFHRKRSHFPCLSLIQLRGLEGQGRGSFADFSQVRENKFK